MRLRMGTLAGMLTLLLVPAALANLVIYDGFDCALGAPLGGQQSPGVGWGGPWGVDTSVDSDLIVPGLTFAGPQYSLAISGNAVKLTA